MYSANYLFSTGGVRWAMDPLRLCHRIAGASCPDVVNDLAGLSFVILTHRHLDHLDMGLIRSLRDLPITWVVPGFLLQHVEQGAGLPPEKIITPTPLEPFELDGIRIMSFDGLHWEWEEPGEGSGSRAHWRGVPAAGYLVESGGQRWLFPGDTRIYDVAQLPRLGPVDILFVHVWLGRAAARLQQPPLLEQFCRFCLELGPSRIVLTHLDEFGRDAEDYWEMRHARQIAGRLRELAPGISVLPARMGAQLDL
jgi:L-ascorbate metabolism protein UlaG (beta-lactamase superfamily)